ncbi:phosphoribosyltransferase [Pseudomonas citronellolis]|uniref:phosphoribosyltransferase n=1 Tax=Pseudomonas citronellolis TaxID=53408 RepID=UPI002271D988|nr:phosphoribosyltransferase [Pseudomonas citronellolis]WAB92592.1 phosphoribosyltransferase [Pseudomonas citronellolis]
MKILDLSNQIDFQKECGKLRDLVEENIVPDFIVGIATGGEYVTKAMNFRPEAKISIIMRQRRSTKTKSSLGLKNILPLLPTSIKNILRKLEVLIREVYFIHFSSKTEEREVIFISGHPLNLNDDSIVLIIDDAIDTGATFIDAYNYVRKINKKTKIYSAALSRTFKKPAFEADYILHDRTLIRGPWALDATTN